MSRRPFLAAIAVILLFPTPALAASPDAIVPPMLHTVVGLIGLVLAVWLMLAALSVRRIAAGAAFADNLAYVMAGVVCIAASVLANWVSRQLSSDLAPDQVQLGADLLVIASMAFFGVYFYRLRRAVMRFLGELQGDDLLASAHVDDDHAEKVGA